MNCALLDVNLLIALFDPQHVFSQRAHNWFSANSGNKWATCPITENGMIRILSGTSYSKNSRFSPSDLTSRIAAFTLSGDHEFWADEVSLLDTGLFDMTRVHSHRNLTGVYLLGLVVKRGGRLVTFDQSIVLSAVRSATDAHLVVL